MTTNYSKGGGGQTRQDLLAENDTIRASVGKRDPLPRLSTRSTILASTAALKSHRTGKTLPQLKAEARELARRRDALQAKVAAQGAQLKNPATAGDVDGRQARWDAQADEAEGKHKFRTTTDKDILLRFSGLEGGERTAYYREHRDAILRAYGSQG